MIMQTVIKIAPNSGTAYKTIHCVPLPNLKSFGSMKIKLYAKEIAEFSVMFYGEMG